MKMMKKAMLMVFVAVFAVLPSQAQHNMHVVILGDSNTSIGGDDCSQPKGWTKWFNLSFKPLSCRSYARSGATWTHTAQTKEDTEENTGVLSDNNVVYNQMLRLRAAVEKGQQPVPGLIIIAAGTNDAWFIDKRSGAFSKSAILLADSLDFVMKQPIGSIRSLPEAVGYSCGRLREWYPDAKIILFTPMQATCIPEERIQKAGDLIERSGNRLGALVVRQDGPEFIEVEMENQKKTRTQDGVHTNEYGARRNGEHLCRVITRMLQDR